MLKVGDRVRYLRSYYEEDEAYNDLYFVVGDIYIVEKIFKTGSCRVRVNGELIMLYPEEFEMVVHEEILDVGECM